MEKKITPFEYGNQELRTVIIDNTPFFVANDVCNLLSIKNSRDALLKLDNDEKRVSVIPTPFGEQNFNIISESGLYYLIMKSRKPEAKKFRKWVTSEVLPTIRKTGSYSLKTDEEKVLEVMTFLTNKIQKQKQLLLQQAPQIQYYKEVLQSSSTYTVTQIAKDLGMTATELNRFLHLQGVQFKQSGQWVLYKAYQDKGYTDTKTVKYNDHNGNPKTVLQTKWTNKGREFICNLVGVEV